MPGVGRAPKLPEQRRNRNQLQRGEWVELTELEQPVLPPFDEDWDQWIVARERDGREIEIRRCVSRKMWDAWRRSPVTSQYGAEDVAAICYLAEAFHTLGDSSRLALMDRLGLTPRGKRDLRWRTPQEVKTIAEQTPVKRLRLTEPEKVA